MNKYNIHTVFLSFLYLRWMGSNQKTLIPKVWVSSDRIGAAWGPQVFCIMGYSRQLLKKNVNKQTIWKDIGTLEHDMTIQY